MELEPLTPLARRLLDEEKRASAAVAVASPEAVSRVWQRFELGAAVTASKLFGGSMLVAGLLMGVGGTLAAQRLLPSSVESAQVSPVARQVVPVEPLAVEPRVVEEPIEAPPAVAKQAASPAPRPTVSPDRALSREQSLLDIGRAALVQKRHEAALDSVAKHRAEYPRGQLAEERDALEIQALWALDRKTEARARTEVFSRAFPQSIFLPALKVLRDTP